ncbi:MAG: hypothetical protein JWQ42_4729 [Edaphobacter sp.]|nr:hypothetical protein [Edaphobacter sp.]
MSALAIYRKSTSYNRQLGQDHTHRLSDYIYLNGRSSDKCAATLLANDITFHA